MLENRKPVNYLEMFPRSIQVAIFGELDHNTGLYKSELLNALPELRRAGFTHLAMEMLPIFLQKELSRYPANKGKVKAFLTKYWQWGSDANVMAFLKIIDKAHSLGMKIVGLDLAPEEHAKYDTCSTDELYNLNGKVCANSSHLERNKVWTNLMHDLAQKGARIVAFMHHWHAVENLYFETGVKELLAQKNIKSATIRMIHPNVYINTAKSRCMTQEESKNEGIAGMWPVITQAYEKGVKHERFYVKGELSAWSRGEDYIVYLPCTD